MDFLSVVKLSISSGVMICLELWYTAVLVLLAGYMEDAEVAISAFSICVRMANELGRRNAKAVNFSIKVLLGTSVVIGVFFFVLCLVFGKNLHTCLQMMIESQMQYQIFLCSSPFRYC